MSSILLMFMFCIHSQRHLAISLIELEYQDEGISATFIGEKKTKTTWIPLNMHISTHALATIAQQKL